MSSKDATYVNKWAKATKNIEKRGIYKRIADYAELELGQDVFEFGVGCAGLLTEVCKRVDPRQSLVVGIDYSHKALEYSKYAIEKAGYDVNLVNRIFYIGNRRFLNNDIDVSLERGKVNLIGDIYGWSNMDYMVGHEFDRVFLAFIGGTSTIPLKSLGGALDDVSLFMSSNGLLINAEKQFIFPDLLTYAETILSVTEHYELVDSRFDESIEDFVTCFFPLTFESNVSAKNSTKSTSITIKSKKRLGATIKGFKEVAKRQPDWKYGITYNKFKLK